MKAQISNTISLLKLLLILALSMATSGCVLDREPEGGSLQVGDKVPDFTIIMNDGSVVTSGSLAGHKSVIIFFHTECKDCRRELPRLQKAMEANPDISFICIAREEIEEQIEEFWQQNGLTLPYSAQTDRKVFELFASIGIPRVYLISPELIITDIYVEELPEDIIW